jgi:hypothetical protein
MLTDWFRREELKTEFLELRSKMRDIYLSWNVSSCDQVGRNCYALFFFFFHAFVAAVAGGQPTGSEDISDSTD